MNYLQTLAKHFPELQVECQGLGDIYEDIVPLLGGILPDKQLIEELHIQDHKEKKIQQLSEECAYLITTGFISNALGAPHKYDAEPEDQLNLTGAVTLTAPMGSFTDGFSTPYAVRPVVNGVYQAKEYKLHTHQQLRQVIYDGGIFKSSLLQSFNAVRNYILTTTLTEEEILAITLSTPISSPV